MAWSREVPDSILIPREERSRCSGAQTSGSRHRKRHQGIAELPKLFEAALEEPALRRCAGELQGAAVRTSRLVGSSEPAQQLGARRMVVAVPLEIEPIDDLEGGLGALRLGDRDGAVELGDRRPRDPGELAIYGCELGPV